MGQPTKNQLLIKHQLSGNQDVDQNIDQDANQDVNVINLVSTECWCSVDSSSISHVAGEYLEGGGGFKFLVSIIWAAPCIILWCHLKLLVPLFLRNNLLSQLLVIYYVVPENICSISPLQKGFFSKDPYPSGNALWLWRTPLSQEIPIPSLGGVWNGIF